MGVRGLRCTCWRITAEFSGHTAFSTHQTEREASQKSFCMLIIIIIIIIIIRWRGNCHLILTVVKERYNRKVLVAQY